MSSRTSSRSTLTMVPSTMSPSLKYLIVRSTAAAKSSAEPMSLTATCGVVDVGGVAVGSGRVSVVDVMWWGAPVADLGIRVARGGPSVAGDGIVHAWCVRDDVHDERGLLPAEAR